MLTVVQCLPSLDHGGVERGTLEVAAALVQRGHRSMVVAGGGRLVPELTAAGSQHIPLEIGRKSLLSLGYVPLLRKLLEEENVDVLHARSRLPAWISYLAWRGMDPGRRPVFITTVHGAYRVNFYSRIMTRGEHVIAVSKFIRQYIHDHYPDMDPARITLIPRGVDSEKYPYRFRPSQEWKPPWDPHKHSGKYLICCPGRITRRKGLEDFVGLVHRLTQCGYPVHGLVAGDADRKNRRFYHSLLARIRVEGIEECFSFLGARDDLREIMSVSSLVAVLSKQPESFGRTALESLSLGVPVLAYDRGGSSEILREMFPEGLVEPDNLEQALEKVKQFMDAPPLVRENRVFTLEKMLDQTLNLYESAVIRVRKAKT